MRYLYVKNVGFEVSDANADRLIASGAIYPCGDRDHDLHLNPEHNFTVDEVEILMSPSDD